MSILVKWRGEEHYFEPPRGGSTMHEAVSVQFRIPPARLKLVHRGKQYSPGESDALLKKYFANDSSVIVAVGTPSSEQLDSTGTGLLAKTTIQLTSAGTSAFLFVVGILNFLWIFVRTMFIPGRQRT